MDKLPLLKSLFFFQDLDPSLLEQLAGLFKETKYGQGKSIFLENDRAGSFYVIVSGEVLIYKHLRPGHGKTLAVLNAGLAFGEMAFFCDSQRTADALAKTDAVLLAIERGDFTKFITDNPQAGVRVLSGLLKVSMDRLDQTSRELATLYQTGNIISSGKSPASIAEGLQEELLIAVPQASNCAVFFYNEFNNEFEAPAVEGEERILQNGSPFIKKVQSEPSGQICENLSAAEIPASMRAAKSFIAVPVTKSALLGFIALWTSAENCPFTAGHRLLLSGVAGQLAEAVENIRFRQDEVNRRRLRGGREGA